MRRTTALIAGGGPAGAAAAILLARAGVKPLLIERSREPQDVVCGGFLSGDAIRLLSGLGIDPVKLGARPVCRVRLIVGQRLAEAELPFAATALSRRALDTALLAHAEAQGAKVERGLTVRTAGAPPSPVHLSDGGMIDADAVFLATGKHDIRGAARSAPVRSDPALGLRAQLAPTAALSRVLDGTIELHLFRGGYAGLVHQEDGTVNLCLSISESRLRAARGGVDALIATLAEEAPIFSERLGGATAIGSWTSIARIPYGWRSGSGQKGLFRVGDQAAVIASLVGDGIAIAIASARAGAEAFLCGGADAASGFQPAFAKQTRRSIEIAEVLRHAAQRPLLALLAISILRAVPTLIDRAAAMTRIIAPQR